MAVPMYLSTIRTRDSMIAARPRPRSSSSAHTAHRRSLGKRLSLASLKANFEKPSSTTLFVTYTAELRGDQDVYMFGLDRCYTTLCEANARVDLLGHCNFNVRTVETRVAECDPETGCMTVTWGRYNSQVRFMATAKKIEMAGEVTMDVKSIARSAGALAKEHEIALFFAETDLDIAEHVWVVAVHKPNPTAIDDIASPRRRSHTRRISWLGLSSKTAGTRSSSSPFQLLDRVAEAGSTPSIDSKDSQPATLGWYIDSIHSNGDKALARAKKAWIEHFSKSHGRCRKLREHYGFARYSFKPASIPATGGRDTDTCVQIRVERVRVVPKGELLSEFSEPREAINDGKVFVPPIRNVGGEVISTAAGRRTSFLDDIFKIANESLGGEAPTHEDLTLTMKIRREHEARVRTLTDQQRHGGGQTKTVTTSADLYHAYQRNPSVKKQRRLPHSKSWLDAHARMAAAVEAIDASRDDEAVENDVVPPRILRREGRRLGSDEQGSPILYPALAGGRSLGSPPSFRVPSAPPIMSKFHATRTNPYLHGTEPSRSVTMPVKHDLEGTPTKSISGMTAAALEGATTQWFTDDDKDSVASIPVSMESGNSVATVLVDGVAIRSTIGSDVGGLQAQPGAGRRI